MRKVVIVPNIWGTNQKFVKLGNDLKEKGLNVFVFDNLSSKMAAGGWSELIEAFNDYHRQQTEKNKELYYITEGWSLVPVLEAAESARLSGIFSLQPIIFKNKQNKRTLWPENTPEPGHLLERTEAPIDFFMAEKYFDNDHRKTIKHLSAMARPNISVKVYETSSVYDDVCLEDIKNLILYRMGIR
ncbi:MAG TPA: hypothetical protein VMX18_02560 [Candidatus Bipolaricaulota bacterium]|nr:hypothetical protein [Candidatus Bipolaricaulota bacterium]